jgi:hypothetical protein
VPKLPLDKREDRLIYLPPVPGAEPEEEYITLAVQYGNVDEIADFEVVWMVPLTPRLKQP